MSEDSRYVYMPRGQSIAEPGVIPAGPLLFTDALRDQRRWSAYYGQPRGTLAPSIIGFRGLGDGPPDDGGALAFATAVETVVRTRLWRHPGTWEVLRRVYPAPYAGSSAEYRMRLLTRYLPARFSELGVSRGDLRTPIYLLELQGRDGRSAPWRVLASTSFHGSRVAPDRWGLDAILHDLYRVSRIGRPDTETASWTRERGAAGLGQCGPCGCPCTGMGSCCSSCARGGPCAGKGTSGLYSSIQTPTDGYAVPVLVGAGIGYLTEKKTGMLVGAALGAFFRWVWGKAEPTVMPIVEAVSPTPVSGFTDDFRWDPAMTDADSSLSKAQFRTLQAILVIGAAALALKVGKTVGSRKNNSGRARRRNRRSR